MSAALSRRTQVLLWGAQRASAAVLALCVLVHLVTIIYAVRSGLTAAEILDRTSGSIGWAAFYAIFVAAVAVHAPIGLRNVLSEAFHWRGRGFELSMLALGVVLGLLVLALVFFIIAALPVPAPVNWLAIGLACLTASMLVGANLAVAT